MKRIRVIIITVYVLGVDGGGNMAFVTFTGETIPAGKAYYVLNQQ